MADFSLDVIYIAHNETILLKFVESFSFGSDSYRETVDKLKDDFCFDIRTISGKEYTISSKFVSGIIKSSISYRELAQGIYDRWLWIHKS